jgi:hypothetical protein
MSFEDNHMFARSFASMTLIVGVWPFYLMLGDSVVGVAVGGHP